MSSSSSSSFLPPQTPMAPPRTMSHTPHKTPLRTPLRGTPGGGIGEQTSHTPVINFAAIEAQKENVQPLRGGRSAHALSNALSQRQAELKAQRKDFEDQVNSVDNAESDDPLDAWTRYVKWCIDSYPSGQTSESELVLVLERCTRMFRSYAQYKNDSRYLRMWVLYARNVEDPSEVFNFLLANEIATRLASLYEELAVVYESQSYFDKADETYRMGIHRTAQPIDRLKRRFDEFQQRVVAQEGKTSVADQRGAYKESLLSAMQKAQRSMLGAKSGSVSMSANSIRGLGGQAGLSKISNGQSTNNARRPAVFKDVDGDDVFAQSKGNAKSGVSSWSDIGTAASRKQEKGVEAKAWKGEVLPQREAGATPKRPAIAVYRDSDEEEDEEDVGRTPGRARAGDVFSKVREPTETDRLRRNPFANYDKEGLKPIVASAPTPPPVKAAKPIKPLPSVHRSSSTSDKVKKPHSSSQRSSNSASTSQPKQKQERYAVPLKRLYPGLDIEQAVKRTSRKHRSGEVCMEELIVQRDGADVLMDSADPWPHLDARTGKWLPEINPPAKPKMMKRDPTVTAFTKAAQEDVMQMFNVGMMDSDDEESDENAESSSDEGDESDDIKILQARNVSNSAKENESIPFTPTPTPGLPQLSRTLADVPMLGSSENNVAPNAAPGGSSLVPQKPRVPFGGNRTPLGVKILPTSSAAQQIPMTSMPPMPQRIASDELFQENEGDDEDSVEEDGDDQGAPSDELDYLNRPMRELAPLSPITEATEYTRYTHSTRTPATVSSRGRGSEGWTPSASTREPLNNSYDDAGDESAYGSLPDKNGRTSLPPLSSNGEAGTVTTYPNPVSPFEDDVIQSILKNLPLPLESSNDFVDMAGQEANQLHLLQRRATINANKQRRSSSQTSHVRSSSDDWTLCIGEYVLKIRQKLGEGGYGAVFLAEDPQGITGGRQRMVGGINGDASFADLGPLDDDIDGSIDDDLNEPKLIAVKVETPPNRWEFYILGQLRARLADERRLSSIICARKFYSFDDESFLLLEYAEKGTLLEIVNNAAKAGIASSSAMVGGGATSAAAGGAGAGSVGVEEILAMFFVVEVIKVVEALHAADLLHGDLKIDNCLLRLDESEDAWTHSYDRNGDNGWSAKGITLIDFGRAVDLRQFPEKQTFTANWTPEKHDMPQIQQGQAWRKEIDYHGIASIAYCLLFGKYIETVASPTGQGYTIDKPLRRYWQVAIWTSLFDLCLNAATVAQSEDLADQLATVRSSMEQWLEENCFRAGKNLKGSLKKLEIWSMKRSM